LSPGKSCQGMKGNKSLVSTKHLRTAYIIIDTERCKGCRYCISVCPQKIIALATGLNNSGYTPAFVIEDDQKCTGCLACATMCPEAAISVYRRTGPASEP
jgi:2-oxoglutarate ferredoxin oxidoreductase subunit delta